MLQIPLDCPYCKKKDVAFTLCYVRPTQKIAYNGLTRIVSLVVCNHCGGGVVGHSAHEPSVAMVLAQNATANVRQIDDLGYGLEWLPEPPKPDIPDHTPPEVLPSLLEAEKLFLLGDDFARSAGNAYRSAVEAALSLKDTESKDKNLNWRINRLVKDGVLTVEMGDFAHHIRQLGNDASHSLLDFTPQDLVQLRLFTKMLIMYLFTLPGMIPAEVPDAT